MFQRSIRSKPTNCVEVKHIGYSHLQKRTVYQYITSVEEARVGTHLNTSNTHTLSPYHPFPYHTPIMPIPITHSHNAHTQNAHTHHHLTPKTNTQDLHIPDTY